MAEASKSPTDISAIAEDPGDQISPQMAGELLIEHFGDVHLARTRLNDAICQNRAATYADGVRVPAHYFAGCMQFTLNATADRFEIRPFAGLHGPNPETKPLEFLLERKKLLTIASWESLYQQHPIVVGGGILPIDKLLHIPQWSPSMIAKSVRYVDKAGTQDGGAHTAGVLMHFVIAHVARGQWGALDREQHIMRWAETDREQLRGDYEIGVEQEPGSGGKESAEATLRMLSGHRYYADKVTGSKEVRCEPFAAQVQGGNVYLMPGEWNHDFLDECESFLNGRFKDQVDAAAGAFARLTSKPVYNLDAMG